LIGDLSSRCQAQYLTVGYVDGAKYGAHRHFLDKYNGQDIVTLKTMKLLLPNISNSFSPEAFET
jgi:hypothetical protein